jgi:hypothetical protein
LAKQPTHSDLMKEIEGLKKRLEKLEPKDELAPYRDLLEEIRKALPQTEYIPYPYPWYPTPWQPYYPRDPWIITYWASNASTSSPNSEGITNT